MVRLGDLGQIITGNTPKTTDAENYASKDIAFIKPSDIQENKLTMLSGAEFYISEYAREKARILIPGCILVTCIGIVGKVAINNIECAFNQQINAIAPDTKKCDTKYIAYAIQSQQHRLQDIANAAVVPILNKTQFSDIEILLPPLEEQRRIAATLNKVSDLIAKRRAQLDKLDLLVKARFVEMFGAEEERKTLSDICSIITDGTHQPPKFVTEGIPFLFVSNVVSNVITYETEKYISQETYNELIKRTPIEPGDILLSTVGSYGHPAIVKDKKKFLFQRHIAYLKPNHEMVYSEYLHSALLSCDVQRQIEEKVKGVAQKTLNLSEIKKISLPIPPMNTQRKFCKFVEQVNGGKSIIEHSLDKLEILEKALMQQYFG